MFSVSPWRISATGLSDNETITNGNRFLIGNGYLGYRGTLEEAERRDMPATIVNGLYDRSGDKWREPVNAPNGLAVRLRAGKPVAHEQSLDFRYGIHSRRTTWRVCGDGRAVERDDSRECGDGRAGERGDSRECGDGRAGERGDLRECGDGRAGERGDLRECGARANVTVEAERFASMDDVHLLCLKYSVCADTDSSVRIDFGIDCDVYDINGPHLGSFIAEHDASFLSVHCRTLELGIPVSVVSAYVLDGSCNDCGFCTGADACGSGTGNTTVRGFLSHESLTLNLRKGKKATLFVYSALYCGNDFTGSRENVRARAAEHAAAEPAAAEPAADKPAADEPAAAEPAAAEPAADKPAAAARKCAAKALEQGWDTLLANHRARWDGIWKTGDVEIEGDEYAQQALRYSLYHLQIIAPRHADALSVSARGLSGQTYKGAVFWDTEMFISPYFLFTDPSVAKGFLRYRIATLGGAKRKAASYGYEGAFYAWESQETGDDACSDFNVVDVFTGRPVRTYFRDKQIHISADIVYALRSYVDATGDLSILREGGLSMALECAKFFMSWAVWSPVRGRYEIHDAIGPDEYHERVANNAFTSRMIAHTFETALRYIDLFGRTDPALLGSAMAETEFDSLLPLLRDIGEKLYMPAPGPDLVIEQFDGYFKLEDCTLAEVRSRLIDPKEYWGGGNGVASSTRIIKQADVVLMLALFGDDWSREVKRANLEYYEPRTEHGSSLSPCVYSLLACETGDSSWGYPFFLKTAEIDMTGDSKQFAGLVYIGGTHPAANGGAWISAVRGFCGFTVKNGVIGISPCLPEKWTKVRFRAEVAGIKYLITVTKDDYSICEL